MTNQAKLKGLHISLWVVQVFLALTFGLAGLAKITSPIEKLIEDGFGFVTDYGIESVQFIGWCEILGAIGLILPAALRFKPILTPLAAMGIATIMVLAVIYHILNNESYLSNLPFLALALFVAWGRWKKAPILPK